MYPTLLCILLVCQLSTAEHVDCSSLPVTKCTDHASCAQCINSITRKSFCMDRHEADKHQGGVIECFDVPPTPPSCTGALEANCKPPCVWCEGRFPGLSGCFDKVRCVEQQLSMTMCAGAGQDAAIDGVHVHTCC